MNPPKNIETGNNADINDPQRLPITKKHSGQKLESLEELPPMVDPRLVSQPKHS